MAVTARPYDRAVQAIDAVSWRGIRPGLERIEALLGRLDSPHRNLTGVLVAGTNGKGSVCALVDSVLRAAGHRSVLLTKPHLVSYCERIVRDGVPVSEERLAELVDRVTAAAKPLPDEMQPTGFEMLTAAGILEAAEHPGDVLVCEVGMGGRLDSTNVLDLGVAVVTNVSLDHCEHLGNTVEAIAGEKAAIIKPGDHAITGATPPALDVVRRRCADVSADLTVVDGDSLAWTDRGRDGVSATAPFAGADVRVASPLIGAFQAQNLAVAVAVCDALRRRGVAIDTAAVQHGCATARWPGRMQWIDGAPALLIDAAHNPAGMQALCASLPGVVGARRVAVLFAAMRDKDAAAMAAELRRIDADGIVVTEPAVQRAMRATELAALMGPGAMAMSSVEDGLARAREIAGAAGVVVVCGSLYLAGEVLTLLGG